VEDGHTVVKRGCGILVDDVFLERGFEGSVPVFTILCLLQDGDTGINRIVKIGIVGNNFRLDSELLPTVPCPFSLRRVSLING
jgi:hypothetical protein